jgi:hypothetical protein
MSFVLIKGFKSTTIWKAFFLNSLVAALVIVIAISVKSYLDHWTVINSDYDPYDSDYKAKRETSFKSIIVTIIVTFLASMITYVGMYYAVGFGGGMMVSPTD